MSITGEKTIFLEILWPKELQPEDIQIIKLPQPDRPGQARLKRARIGDPDGAPNSRPLLSESGAKIGYIADVSALNEVGEPYDNTYLIQ